MCHVRKNVSPNDNLQDGPMATILLILALRQDLTTSSFHPTEIKH